MLQIIDKVQIRVRRECHRRMAEALGNGLYIISGQKSIDSVRMAEIVESGIHKLDFITDFGLSELAIVLCKAVFERDTCLVPSHQM